MKISTEKYVKLYCVRFFTFMIALNIPFHIFTPPHERNRSCRRRLS
jgi:hypothetical protein